MPRTTTADAPAREVSAGQVPAQRPAARRGRRDADAVPLGSLTQRPVAEAETCPACGGAQLTSLAMTLTDGTAVRFSSCRRCEHRRWESEGDELTISDVLAHTRKRG